MDTARFQIPWQRPLLGALLLLGCIGGAGQAAERADRLLPRRDLAASRPQRLERARLEHQRQLPPFLVDTRRNPELAKRGLLTRRVRSRSTLPQVASVQDGVDTVRVLLVRMAFESNREPALTSMPENGDFMLHEDLDVIVDPPPHDASYFEAHLLCMQRYYEVVSHGRLLVEGTVFPPLGEPSLKLTDIADYGPGAGGFWTLEAFESYFKDAITLLDQEAEGKIDLSPYVYDPTGERLGSIFLMHPGSDLQNDINQDSPNDLPTFFITLADSVPVMGGTQEVRTGLVLPETTTQDGLIGSIQGPMSHEFGHQLGLPDWYDTRFGLPRIGEWSLMDSGSAALFAFIVEGREDEPIFALSLLPTGLCAMDRILLGWEEPVLLQAPRDSVTLRPANADERYGDFPTSARLDVSPEEYFLVENRRDLLAFRFPGDQDFCPYLNRDAQTGVVLWMSKDDPSVESRLRHNTGEYDFWISAPTAPDDAPGEACAELGFGLLVWHVDERPLAEGYPTNTVNNDEDYRALRLVEASGDYEIGDWRMPTVSYLGDGWNDPFRAGYRTELREQTVPNNWNNDWALTGWEITNVTPSIPESHVLHVEALDVVAGWPRIFYVDSDSLLQVEPQGGLVASVEGIGRVLAVADSSALHLFAPTARFDQPVAAMLPATLAFAGKSFAGDAWGTLAALANDTVTLWQAQWSGTELPLRALPLPIPAGAGSRLALDEDSGLGVAETADGAWMLFDNQGTNLGTFDLLADAAESGVVLGDLVTSVPGVEVALVTPASVEIRSLPALDVVQRLSLDLPETGSLFVGAGQMDGRSPEVQIVVLHESGSLRVLDAGGAALPAYPNLPADTYRGMALADVDGDGFLDLVSTSASRIVGLNSLGARLFSTPRVVRDLFALRIGTTVTTPPIVADVAGDGLPEILFTTDLGLIYAVDADGGLVDGFPRKALPDLFPARLLADDLDGDETTREVIGLSSSSACVFALSGGDMSHPGWTARHGGPGRTSFAEADGIPVADGATRLHALERSFLAHPNPCRGDQVLLRIAAPMDGAYPVEGPYEISIYNLEGELVFENRGTTRAGTTQEVPWSVSNVASGVYLCRFLSAAAGVPMPVVERITVLR